MNRIRVLEVLEATEGGTRTHLRDLVLGLDSSRFAVDVAVSIERDPSFTDDLARFRATGATVHIGHMVREIRPTDLASLAWLRRVIGRGRYDIVHAHSSKAGVLARLASRLAGVPVRLYTPNAFRFLAPEISGFERHSAVLFERVASRWGTHLIAVSPSEQRAALQAGVARLDAITVIPNGIDLERLDRQAAGGGGRAAMAVADDAFCVLTIGRRVRQKGDRYLVEAWPEVVAALPRAVLVVVGDGPRLELLREQAERLGVAHSVRWLHQQDNVGRLYAGADAYVLPSLYEGCPYTILEAMAMGLPVAATAVAGSIDLIEHERTGLQIPPADAGALAAALIRLGRDEALRVDLGAAARLVARREYTAETMVARTALLYERLVREVRLNSRNPSPAAIGPAGRVQTGGGPWIVARQDSANGSSSSS